MKKKYVPEALGFHMSTISRLTKSINLHRKLLILKAYEYVLSLHEYSYTCVIVLMIVFLRSGIIS